VNADPTNSIIFLKGTLKCGGISDALYDVILFVLMLPIVFLFTLFILSGLMMSIYLPESDTSEVACVQRERYYRHFYFVLTGLCFLSYVPCSAAGISIFNCDDLGVSGSFLFLDYTVACTDHAYDGLFALGVLALIVFCIGIPLMFVYILRNGQSNKILKRASDLISKGQKKEYKYWEVSDLGRKLLLTSIVQLVMPGSGSQW
jgi:hypothetical protein